jgi:hypothetical protein
MPFKLTNIWGLNWPEFWSKVKAESPSDDFQELKEFFDEQGDNIGKVREDIAGVVTIFKNSATFRECFGGYADDESDAIVSSISIVPEAAQNFEKICKAVTTAYFSMSQQAEDDRNRKLVEGYLAGNTPIALLWRETKNPTIKSEILAGAEYVADYNLNDNGIIGRLQPDTKIKVRAALKPKITPTKTDFAPLLSKLSSVEQLKEIIGGKVLFVSTDKSLAHDELNYKGRNNVSRDNVCAFRVSAANRLEYWEIASYTPSSFIYILGNHFTEITGESNSYGPRKNIDDERIVAFVLLSIRKGKKITIADEVLDSQTLSEFDALKTKHIEARNAAMEILRPVEATSMYMDNYRTVPMSMVFYNHDYPYDEIRFQLGDKLVYFNQQSYGSRPIIEEGPGKDAWLNLTRSFLTASNSMNHSGYNKSWSVYRASASQKKQVYEKLTAASDAYMAFVKLATVWLNNIK